MSAENGSYSYEREVSDKVHAVLRRVQELQDAGNDEQGSAQELIQWRRLD